MSSCTRRILHWIRTNEHIFETDYVESTAVESTIGTEKVQECSVENVTTTLFGYTTKTSSDNPRSGGLSDGSLEDLSPHPQPVELLVGFKDDLLIPSTDQIHYTFLRGQKIWRSYITRANSLPSTYVLAGAMDPRILLQEMPPLPRHLPKRRSITGEAIWHVPSPELPKYDQASEQNKSEDWNPEYVHGVKKTFILSVSKPTECRISNRSDFRFDNARPNEIAILVLL